MLAWDRVWPPTLFTLFWYEPHQWWCWFIHIPFDVMLDEWVKRASCERGRHPPSERVKTLKQERLTSERWWWKWRDEQGWVNGWKSEVAPVLIDMAVCRRYCSHIRDICSQWCHTGPRTEETVLSRAFRAVWSFNLDTLYIHWSHDCVCVCVCAINFIYVRTGLRLHLRLSMCIQLACTRRMDSFPIFWLFVSHHEHTLPSLAMSFLPLSPLLQDLTVMRL